MLEHVEPLSSGLEFMCMHDGLADIYVYYAFMSCDERSVSRH